MDFPLTPGASQDPLEKRLHGLLERYLTSCRAAHTLAAGLRVVGVGLRPVLDHFGFRSLHAGERAREYLMHGYAADSLADRALPGGGHLRIFRKPGYPALAIEEPGETVSSKDACADWIRTFSDQDLFYAAVLVEDVESAVFYLEKQGIPFMGRIEGDRGADLRMAVSEPESLEGRPRNFLCLLERRHGCCLFPYPAGGLSSLNGSTRKR